MNPPLSATRVALPVRRILTIDGRRTARLGVFHSAASRRRGKRVGLHGATPTHRKTRAFELIGLKPIAEGLGPEGE